MLQGLPATEVWSRWTGQVIDGLFPLESCIGGSDHSAVFLTENPERNGSKAALKLVPALPTIIGPQIARWNTAAGLNHRHLLRLLYAGQCRLAENEYLYVVMEYADQNLGELLQHRALTQEEVWELLPPIVDALGFLHRRHLVHGHLKPSNVLVVGDTVKLSSDTIRGVGQGVGSYRKLSVYDPPEMIGGTAGDIWALGVTLGEGLTRVHPSGTLEPGEDPVPPGDCPATFVDVVRRCLSYEPADRPSVADIKSWMEVARHAADSEPSAVDVATVRQSAVRGVPSRRGIKELPGRAASRGLMSRRWILALPILVSIAILLVCWATQRAPNCPRPNNFTSDALTNSFHRIH